MPPQRAKLPIGNEVVQDAAIRTSAELGVLVRERRKRLALNQLDIAGLGNTGNRFIVELENGKPTVQLQKVLDVMDLLGLEVIVRVKTARAL
ncbi:MAG: type II toxin-antitoxin system Y4mF family antitoxin [Burkholderiales bacterium]